MNNDLEWILVVVSWYIWYMTVIQELNHQILDQEDPLSGYSYIYKARQYQTLTLLEKNIFLKEMLQ
jgi:hypothetical protein